MIRILIEDGDDVIVDALINVEKRRVEKLWVEELGSLAPVYLAESLLALELEIEMARRGHVTPKAITVAEWAESRIVLFSASEKATPVPRLLIVDDLTEAKRIGNERLKPALTNEDRARAMGLVQCRTEREASCAFCEHKWGYWLEIDAEGFVKRGVCNACLPEAFDRHLKEQADLDRLVEADGGLKPELRTEKRAADLECEGGASPS